MVGHRYDFLHEAAGAFQRLRLHFLYIAVCTATLEVSAAHASTYDSNILPPSAVCCGSWSAASVNWLQRGGGGEKGAAGHEQRKRWRPIENHCTRSIFAPYGQSTRSDSCHSPPHRAPSPTERKNVNLVKSMLSAGQLYSQLILSIRLLEMQASSLGKHW